MKALSLASRVAAVFPGQLGRRPRNTPLPTIDPSSPDTEHPTTMHNNAAPKPDDRTMRRFVKRTASVCAYQSTTSFELGDGRQVRPGDYVVETIRATNYLPVINIVDATTFEREFVPAAEVYEPRAQ